MNPLYAQPFGPIPENPNPERRCDYCGKAFHWLGGQGSCPVVIARTRNEILEEAAKVADRWNDTAAKLIRDQKDLEAARGINQPAGIAMGSEGAVKAGQSK